MPEFIPTHVPAIEADPPLDSFTEAFLRAAEWLLPDHDEEPRAEDAQGFAPSAVKWAQADCAKFQRENAEALALAYEHGGERGEYDESSAGHDFFLTREGHGAGFWDRGLGEIGETLSEAARRYGEADAYIGEDDGETLIFFGAQHRAEARETISEA